MGFMTLLLLAAIFFLAFGGLIMALRARKQL
jgi:hypothetical protein